MKEGWETKKLIDVATLQRGFDLPTQDRSDGTIPLVTSSGISDTVSESAVQGPGVATGRSGSIGNVFFVNEDFWPLNTVLYVKDFHGNDPRFIFYLLQHFDLKRFASGAGVPTLNRNSVHGELVNIPPLPEQQRIVALLDEAFEALATAKANAEQNLQNARTLFESHLQKLFEAGRQKWDTCGKPLTELCELIVDCEHKTAPTQAHGIPSIRTPNIGKGRLLLDDVNRVSEETYLQWTRRAEPQGGDLILAREAPAGNVALIPSNIQVCLGQRTVLIRPQATAVDSSFLAFMLLEPATQARLLKHSRGATVQHVNMRDIRALTIEYLPTINEQRAIAATFWALEKESQNLTSIYERKLAALEELKTSLLHQAFNGEL